MMRVDQDFVVLMVEGKMKQIKMYCKVASSSRLDVLGLLVMKDLFIFYHVFMCFAQIQKSLCIDLELRVH